MGLGTITLGLAGRKKIAVVTGFFYGLVLAFYAVAWGVDGPTLTMPLAASPLNIPAALLDSAPSQMFSSFLPAAILVPIVIAPFGWSAMAVLAMYGQSTRSRAVTGCILAAHYIGVGVWFYVVGNEYLMRPFRVLKSEGVVLLAFYAAGQAAAWWALLRRRDYKTLLPSR